MTKATRIINKYHIKEMLLNGNPQFENFYKEELVQFCEVAREMLKQYQKENQELKKQREDINNFITKCGFVNVEQLALAYIGLQEQLEEWKELLNKFKIQ